MAIAVDNTGQGFQNAGTSLTVSYTTSGSDRALLVSLWVWNGTISGLGVTYNGTAMTELINRAADSGNVYIFGLVNPTSGANNIVVSNANSVQIFMTCASYTGVHQTHANAFPDTETSGSANSTNQSLSITTSVDQSWTFMNTRTPSRSQTAGSGTTKRVINTTSQDAATSFDSGGGVSTGSNALNYTVSPSQTCYNVMTAFAPAAAAGPANLKSLDTNLKANIKSWNTNAIANIKSINTNT